MRFSHLLLAAMVLTTLPATARPAEAEHQRPRIGLALSGGGARGGAHIGVLRALEELQVPIDYIAGTSMGAIVGGYYAAGYSPDEIERIVSETNWIEAFSDQPDRRGTTMRKKALDAKFLIPHRVGFNRGRIQLPLGAIEGQQLDQIFERVLMGVREISDFEDLRIPFRAVATDLATGAEVVIGEGSLPDAIRASMSVPGVFAPVLLDNRILVDGGMVNNLPISVVRSMGADIVIAVDISSPLLVREELTSVVSVTEQLSNFLTRRNTIQQLATLGPRDVLIVPQLGQFSAADFVKVLDIVADGYDAVMVSRAALVPLRSPGESRAQTVNLAAAAQDPYVVEYIEINNRSVLNDDIIRSRLRLRPGEALDIARLEDDIDHVYSLDVFQSVTYDLETRADGSRGVIINAIPRSWGPNYLQFGLEISDDFAGNTDFSLGAAYTRNALNSLGGEMRVEFTLGREDLLEFDFYQPIDRNARWFIEPRVFGTREQYNVFEGDDFVAQLEIPGVGFSFGLGRNFSSTDLLRLEYELFRGDADVLIGDTDILGEESVDIGEVVLEYRHDSQDNPWFPTSGHLYVAGLRAARDSLGAEIDYEQAYFGGSMAYTLGRNSGLLSLEAGYSIDDAAPLERWFELGGFGRLSGLVPDQLLGRHAGLATLALYRRLNDVDLFPVFAGFTLEAGNVWRERADIDFASLRYSGSVFLGADTPLGPLYLAYGRSDNGDSTAYLFLGNPWKARRY
ncbi:patatin-like phospholipase family protein [Elongatibacter sediminis]|uniref:Patatin-like phospholipase family protein n=1 Tax=Elongatibacter sediminis TaxID=3119006 RepID=A0AAW9RG81_9GAMM